MCEPDEHISGIHPLNIHDVKVEAKLLHFFVRHVFLVSYLLFVLRYKSEADTLFEPFFFVADLVLALLELLFVELLAADWVAAL